MAKLKVPLLSFNARGTIADILTFQRVRKLNIVHLKSTIQDKKSDAQLSWRTMYQMCSALWHTLSDAEKSEWNSLGAIRHMTGFAWWQSQCLRPNPGIYLPLLGGIMQGQIAMATNSIIGLPHPTGTGHATRKSYVDDIIAAHAALPNAHHTPPDPATKEVYFLATYGTYGATPGQSYRHPAYLLDTNDEVAFIGFHIPHDFNTIDDLVLIVRPLQTATMRLTFFSYYAAAGQIGSTHGETEGDRDTAFTDNIITEMDISNLFSVLSAGDYCGLQVKGNAGATPELFVYAIRLKYS